MKKRPFERCHVRGSCRGALTRCQSAMAKSKKETAAQGVAVGTKAKADPEVERVRCDIIFLHHRLFIVVQSINSSHQYAMPVI